MTQRYPETNILKNLRGIRDWEVLSRFEMDMTTRRSSELLTRSKSGKFPYTPISAKRRLWIGFKDSFDYPLYFTSAIFGGINQWENTSPQFGQGRKG